VTGFEAVALLNEGKPVQIDGRLATGEEVAELLQTTLVSQVRILHERAWEAAAIIAKDESEREGEEGDYQRDLDWYGTWFDGLTLWLMQVNFPAYYEGLVERLDQFQKEA
jgi:hypothetical protein